MVAWGAGPELSILTSDKSTETPYAMKPLCITGVRQIHVELVAALLATAGMQSACPAPRSPPFTMENWHQLILERVAGEISASEGGAEVERDSLGRSDAVESALQNVLSQGRLWEQLASDVFLANVHSGVWGWADCRSVPLLDFWLGFESGLRFILVTTSLDSLLADSVMTAETADLDKIVEEWQRTNENMLRFYNRNSARCVLVDADDCLANPEGFVQHCRQQWKLPLETLQLAPAVPHEGEKLQRYLAGLLKAAYPEAESLQRELNSTCSFFNVEQAGLVATATAELINDYRFIRGRSEELKLVAANLAAALTDKRQLESGLLELQEASESRLAAATAELAQVTDSWRTVTRALEDEQQVVAQLHKSLEGLRADISVQKAESELFRSESDHLKIDCEKLRREKSELQRKLEKLTGELEKAALEQKSLELQLSAGKKALAEKVGRLEKLTTEHDRNVRQLAEQSVIISDDSSRLQEYEKKVADRERRFEKTRRELTGLQQAHAEMQARAAQLAAELEAAHRSVLQQSQLVESSKVRIRNAEIENEMLLRHMHQAQEGFESSFLENRVLKDKSDEINGRLNRLLQRNPTLCEYESITHTRADGADSIRWQIRNLRMGQRLVSTLDFSTQIRDGVLVLELSKRSAAEGGLFVRWPGVVAGDDTIMLACGKQPSTEGDRALLSLAHADWQLLQALLHVIEEVLSVEQQRAPELKSTRAALAVMKSNLSKLPDVVRFANVLLQHEQVNPDYEHLAIRLSGVTFAGEYWPEFEFRVSCAEVGPRQFGKYPKVEFAESVGQAPFDSWFAESRDDGGVRLELRFALPASMDIGVWEKLSIHDKRFIAALVDLTPWLLDELESEGVAISRDWQHWKTMVMDMRQILMRLGKIELNLPVVGSTHSATKRDGR